MPGTAVGPADGILSVRQLTAYVKHLLDSDGLLQHAMVRGEISNFVRASSGHLYFTLKDADSQLRCACFRGVAQGLKFDISDGDRVVVGGAISVYEKTGQYQLIARFMRPDGAGDLAAQLELLRARLEAEGLFDPSRKRCLPFIPRAIAVCTSPTGAAVRDICSIIARRWPLARVQVIPTAVQGAEAVPGLLRALELANGLDDVDVIIVGRGGGSIEDLWAFNEEPVVRAIFASRTPVISAVGHETDFTLADFAADVRAATPSMAAELAVPDHHEVAALLISQGRHLRSALTARLQQQHRLLDRLAAHPLLSRPEALLEQRGQRLDDAAAALSGNLARRVERLRARTERVVASLEALSPLAVIGRGYSILQRADGAVVRRLADASLGDDLTARVADGHISAQVTALKPTGEPA